MPSKTPQPQSPAKGKQEKKGKEVVEEVKGKQEKKGKEVKEEDEYY